MMSNSKSPNSPEIDITKNNNYSSLKTDLTLSLPGSQDQLTHPNATNPPKTSNIYTSRDFDDAGKWGLSVDSSQCQLALFSNGASKGTGKVLNVLEVGKTQLKDMDVDVASFTLRNKPTANAPAPKAQVVGWPPIRSYRKNSVASASTKNINEADGKSGVTCLYVKVSMDGAPYLRKVDLKLYKNYKELLLALKKMFSSFPVGKEGPGDSHLNDLPHGSKCVLTYEDKDGDWMLVGDVPWEMFTSTCKRLRIMKGSEAIGLAPGGLNTEAC